MDSRLGNDVGVEAVAEFDRVDVVTAEDRLAQAGRLYLSSGHGRPRASSALAIARVDWAMTRAEEGTAYHSKSLYMMVKKTWRNRLTALINTANRKSHASPDIMTGLRAVANDSQAGCESARAEGVAAGSCGEALSQALAAAHNRDEEPERVGQGARRRVEDGAVLCCRARDQMRVCVKGERMRLGGRLRDGDVGGEEEQCEICCGRPGAVSEVLVWWCCGALSPPPPARRRRCWCWRASVGFLGPWPVPLAPLAEFAAGALGFLPGWHSGSSGRVCHPGTEENRAKGALRVPARPANGDSTPLKLQRPRTACGRHEGRIRTPPGALDCHVMPRNRHHGSGMEAQRACCYLVLHGVASPSTFGGILPRGRLSNCGVMMSTFCSPLQPHHQPHRAAFSGERLKLDISF